MNENDEYYEKAVDAEEIRKNIDHDKYIDEYEKDYSGELEDSEEEIVTDSSPEEVLMQDGDSEVNEILDRYDSEAAYIISKYLDGKTDRLPTYEFLDEIKEEANEINEILEERYEGNCGKKFTNFGVISAGYGVLVYDDMCVKAQVMQNNRRIDTFISPIRENCSRSIDFSNKQVDNLQRYLAGYIKHTNKKGRSKVK